MEIPADIARGGERRNYELAGTISLIHHHRHRRPPLFSTRIDFVLLLPSFLLLLYSSASSSSSHRQSRVPPPENRDNLEINKVSPRISPVMYVVRKRHPNLRRVRRPIIDEAAICSPIGRSEIGDNASMGCTRSRNVPLR